MRGWVRAASAALVLAAVSLVSNITTWSQLSGRANGVLAARLVISKLANCGTVWAGLAVLAGWFVAGGACSRGAAGGRGRGTVEAALAGVLACELALVAHYAAGQLLGVYDGSIWPSNWYWFVGALVFGAPLGVVGAMARRRDVLGLLCLLVVPLGAVAEPFVLHMFAEPAILPWPQRLSSAACGAVLLALGVAAGLSVLRRGVRPAR